MVNYYCERVICIIWVKWAGVSLPLCSVVKRDGVRPGRELWTFHFATLKKKAPFPSACLAPLPPPLSPDRTRLSVYCLAITLTPCHCLYLLFELVCLSVSPALLFLSTLLACFCQTVFRSVSSSDPRSLSRHLLCLLLTGILSYITTAVSVCAHNPGVCLSWVFLMMS